MGDRRLFKILLWLLVVAVIGCSSIGQRPAESTKPEGSPIIVKGKIDFMKNLGGYYILGDVPAREYFIMNTNPEVLEDLFKSGKTVTIEGRIVRGAEYLFIDRIDGRPYAGQQ
jgi:hypothetical protein